MDGADWKLIGASMFVAVLDVALLAIGVLYVIDQLALGSFGG